MCLLAYFEHASKFHFKFAPYWCVRAAAESQVKENRASNSFSSWKLRERARVLYLIKRSSRKGRSWRGSRQETQLKPFRKGVAHTRCKWKVFQCMKETAALFFFLLAAIRLARWINTNGKFSPDYCEFNSWILEFIYLRLWRALNFYRLERERNLRNLWVIQFWSKFFCVRTNFRLRSCLLSCIKKLFPARLRESNGYSCKCARGRLRARCRLRAVCCATAASQRRTRKRRRTAVRPMNRWTTPRRE